MPRRILLFITDLQIGGTPTVVRELAVRLNDPPRVCVEVACLSSWGPVADQLKGAGISVTAFGARGASDLWVVQRLADLVRTRRFDTVFSFLVHANAVAAAAGLMCEGVRFLQSIQTTQATPAWHWGLQRFIHRAAEKLVVPSPSVAEVARQRVRARPEKIAVIPNAVDPADFPPSPIPWDDPRPYPIGFIGRLDPIKRVPDLLAAVALLNHPAQRAATEPGRDGPVDAARRLTATAPGRVGPVVAEGGLTATEPGRVGPVDAARRLTATEPGRVGPVVGEGGLTATEPGRVGPVDATRRSTATEPGRVGPVVAEGGLTATEPGRVGPVDAERELTDHRFDRGDTPRLGGSVAFVHLHIFGDGPERAAIERQIQMLNVSDTVTMHGAVRRPQEALHQIGLLVLPSASEGFGLVLIEAMAAGVPVIARQVPGVRDVVRDGDTGILAASLLIPPLAEAIGRIVTDRELRARFIENGKRDVAKRFSWTTVLGQYRALLGIPSR